MFVCGFLRQFDLCCPPAESEYQQSDRCFQLQRVIEDLHASLETAHGDARDAAADRADLLQLIDVMAATPVAVKSILEAFLNKLGTSLLVSLWGFESWLLIKLLQGKPLAACRCS